MIETVIVEADVVQLRTTRRGWPSSCNVYLIRDGHGSVMVDTGLGVEPDLGHLVSAADAALSTWGQSLGGVHTILLTHTHSDHAGGTVPLARMTGARVRLPARGWAQASDPWWQVHHILPPEVQSELDAHGDFDVAAHFRADTMPVLFAEATDVDFRLVEDGDAFQAGRYLLKAFHLPGHDVAHLGWVDMNLGLAFTGDLMMARGTALPWYPPNAGGVHAYLDSLKRLGELPVSLACPGHNAIIRGKDEVTSLVHATVQAILDRDRRLLTTLLGAPSTFGALDDLIYGGDVRDVIPWASSVTMAHLRRLEEAGLLSRRPDGRYVTEALAAERYLRELSLPPA